MFQGSRAHRGGGYKEQAGTKKPPNYRGFHCGRYWDRTSDLFRVREARYRCANRPIGLDSIFTAMFGIQHWALSATFERMTRFELATLTLAR